MRRLIASVSAFVASFAAGFVVGVVFLYGVAFRDTPDGAVSEALWHRFDELACPGCPTQPVQWGGVCVRVVAPGGVSAGQVVTEDDVRWMETPESTVMDLPTPDPVGRTARLPLLAGDPFRAERLQ